MSSIISDLFFGSKQNILDNYLVNRHENQQQSSFQHQKHETVVYSSFIELVIRIPALTEREESMMFKVEAEMGTKIDEGFIEVKPNQRESEAIVLLLNELEKQDLNRYTNIKLTISEGKYSKVHGFIPIESIKNIASSFSNEKTIIVHMKGKKNFPFSSIQCTIRTEFPNNNVLNSQILRSVDKDHESYQISKEQVSDQSSQIQVQHYHKQTAKRRGNQSSLNDQGRKYLQRQDNIVIDDKGSKKKSSGNIDKFQPGMTEFVKEIKSIQVQFTKIELMQSLQKQQGNIRLKLGQRLFGLQQTVEITQITKQGVNIDLMSDNQVIGSIHLSPLLLTLQKISGELPIYSAQDQCLGTITIQSPNQPSPKHTHSTIPQHTIINHSIKQPQIDTKKQLVCLLIDRILMINSWNPLNSSSFLDSSQNDTYDFAKLQHSKLQVLVRINGVSSKFTDIVLHYNVDRDIIKIAELRRREGFVCRYYEDCSEERLNIEVQVFSAYRLISYSKASYSLDEKISHKFLSGDTSCPFFHCAIHLKAIRLQVQAELFQNHKMNSIFSVMQDILSNRIMLNRTDDSQIKSIMAIHKKTTYIELKKLLTLLQSSLKQIHQFQQNQMKCVYFKENPERNEAMIKLSYRLLEEFLYIDIKNQKVVRKEDFEKVIEFYKEDLEVALGKDFEAFISQPIVKDSNILFVFFVAGFYSVNDSVQEPQSSTQQVKEQVRNPHKQPQHAQLIQTIKEISVISQPSYLISKIAITNAHLLNIGKAPNLTLNITKKVSYSNSNPEFVIEKEVSLLNPIQICHKSIAEDRVIVLAEFKPTRRQTLYELEPSGKCYAKITWGL